MVYYDTAIFSKISRPGRRSWRRTMPPKAAPQPSQLHVTARVWIKQSNLKWVPGVVQSVGDRFSSENDMNPPPVFRVFSHPVIYCCESILVMQST
jgi:hypothetical protein